MSAPLPKGVAALPFLLLLAGCISPGYRTAPVEPLDPAPRLPYSSVCVHVEPGTAEDVAKELTELGMQISEQIMDLNVVPRVIVGDASAADPDALMIHVSVTQIRKVSGLKRFFLGAFAGKASLTSEVEFSEASTGRHLGTYQITGESGGSGLSGGTGDAVRQTAAAVVEILRDAYSIAG